MPTTIHIPEKLLRSVDREAKKLKVSRNKFIVEALERRLAEATRVGPSPGFLERMRERARDPEYVKTVHELFDSIEKKRKSSKPIIKF